MKNNCIKKAGPKFPKKVLICAGLCSLLFILSALCPGPAGADPETSRKFLYHIYWSGIKAGEAVMEYRDTPEGFTIKTHATSSAFLSIFYKVDDIAQSILYQDGYPKNYLLQISEGRTRKDKTAHFTREAEGSSQKIIYYDRLKDETREYYSEKPAHDPLSAFYEMTKRDLKVGQSEYIHIFDNKKLMSTEIAVLKEEKIRVPAGEFETLLVNPRLETEGIFLKEGAMHIWVTADARRVPVLFESKAKIGSFTAKLMKEYR